MMKLHTLLVFLFISTSLVAEEIIVLDEEFQKILTLDLADLGTVSIASKRKENIHDAPGIISIITEEEIKQFGARDLTDVLARASSIQIIDSHFFSQIVSIRGQTIKHTNDEILFLINGRPHRNSMSGGAYNSLLLSFPLETIKQIEIVRGPGSVLYGSGAFSGAINIVTKSPQAIEKTGVKVSYGSLGSASAEAISSFNKGDLQLIAGIKKFTSDGWKFTATGENGITDSLNRENDGASIMATANFKGLSFNGFYGKAKQINIGSGVRWPATTQDTEHWTLDVGYEHSLGVNWDMSYNLTYNGIDLTANTAHHYSNDILFEPTLKGTIGDNSNLLFGLIYEYQDGLVSNTDAYNSDSYSIYGQLDHTFANRLKLLAGAQWNKPKNVKGNISPRLALNFKIHENWDAKLSYAEAFRSASGVERAISLATLQGNPAVAPELIKTSEAQLLFQKKKYSASLAYYHSKISNVITRTSAGGAIFTFTNSGSIDFDGLEFETKAKLTDELSLLGSATYQKNEDNTGIDDFTLAPNLMAKLGLAYDNGRGYSLGIFTNYFDTPAAARNVNATVAEVNPEAESHALVTLNAELDLPKLLQINDMPDITLSLFVDNLLDEDIHYPEINRKRINSIPQYMGRSFFATVNFEF